MQTQHNLDTYFPSRQETIVHWWTKQTNKAPTFIEGLKHHYQSGRIAGHSGWNFNAFKKKYFISRTPFRISRGNKVLYSPSCTFAFTVAGWNWWATYTQQGPITTNETIDKAKTNCRCQKSETKTDNIGNIQQIKQHHQREKIKEF